jgi:DNA polymerase III epsilon subunit-like protein
MRRMTITAKYLVIDTETTGLDPHKNGLIQCAALALDRELDVVAEYNVFICPPDSVLFDEEATKIHNIPIKKIKEGLSYTAFAHDFIDFVAENFNTKPILIGQFFAFDYGFLSTVFDQAMDQDAEIKARLKAQDGDQYGLFQALLSRNFIDTKSLASSLNLKAELISKPPLFQETSLSKVGGLKDTLMIPQDKFQAHDALGDCYATREVLIKMMDLLTITSLPPII